MRVRFQVLNSALKGLQCESDKEVVLVGRSSRNDLCLAEPSISRFHARICVGDGEVTVEDAGSRNQSKVDGEQINRPTPIRDGSVVLFGNVAVAVTFPDSAQMARQDAEVTPSGGTLVKSPGREQGGGVPAAGAAAVPESWFGKPGEARLPVRAGMGKEFQRRLWPALALVSGLAAAAVLTLIFLERGEGPWQELGIVLRVDDDKVVEVPWGFVHRAEVEDPGVARVSRPMELDLAVQVTGRSQGVTTVKLHDAAGQEHILLHVKVLPRGQEEAERVLADQVRSDEERVTLARERMKLGNALARQDAVYEAMKQYESALAILEPFASNPNREYDQARKRHEEAQHEVQDRYERLLLAMGGFIKDGDKRMGLERLAEIKGLIPDQRDVRRQNADLLFRLLDEMIERERRGGRRTP